VSLRGYMVNRQEIWIPATDGERLAATLYRSDREAADGALVVAGAVGRRRQSYALFAEYFARQGWDVVTFDYRGIGDSRQPWKTAAVFSMLDWAQKDLAGVIDWVREQSAGSRVILVGHSIGGQLAAHIPPEKPVTAMIAVAAQRGYWKFWPRGRRAIVYLFFRIFVPLAIRLRGFLPLTWMRMQSLPREAARDWARWGLNVEYADAGGALLRERYGRFSAPILAISFADDLSLAPKHAVDVLFSEYYVGAPRTRWHVDPVSLGLARLGHSGFFDEPAAADRLWPAVAEWIRTAGERCRSGVSQVNGHWTGFEEPSAEGLAVS
jgi:predicted alpha/beta hydrolase